MEHIPEDLKADLTKAPSVDVLLGHTFRVWHEGRSFKDYWVRLTPVSLILSPTRGDDKAGICCMPKGPDLTITNADIVSCRPAQYNDEMYYMKKSQRSKVKPEDVGHPVFMIVAHPLVNKKGKRERKVLYFHHMPSSPASEEFLRPVGKNRKRSNPHLSEAMQIRDTWVHSILTTFFPLLNEEPLNTGVDEVWSDAAAAAMGMGGSRPQRRLLIVLNPTSGTGSATKIMSSVVGPMLQEAGIEYEVLITERQGHAHEIVQAEPNLSKRWKGIAVVGGDGTFYEVLNGIFARPDWQDVFKQVPLGTIPGGSGNGLARSLLHEQGEPYNSSGCITSSALNVARGNSRPMDLYLAETKAEDGVVQQNVGFLQISYGLIADLDIESEVIRSLGAIRFTIFALLRIAKLRKYRAKLWYKACKKKTPIVPEDIDEEVSEKSAEEGKENSSISCTSEVPAEDEDDAKSSINNEEGVELDNERDVQEVTLETEQKEMNVSSPDLETEGELIEPGYYFDGGQKATYGTLLTAGHLYFRSWNELQAQFMPPMPSQFSTRPPPPPLPSLPPLRPPRQKFQTDIPELNQDLKSESHDGWTFEEDEYIIITLLNVPYIDSEGWIAPGSRIDDGLLHLLLVRKEVPKGALLKFLNEVEEGKHVHTPGVELIPVEAFRLIPLDRESGYMTTDGESIPVGPVQAQVMKSMVNLYIK